MTDQDKARAVLDASHNQRRNSMLNSESALIFVERIEAVRSQAENDEGAILAELRAMPDYEQNQDKDLLEATRLRAEAREAIADADTLIGSFDWTYNEATGDNVRKSSDAD